MKGRVLAIDQGTTSTRAIVFDARRCACGDGAAGIPAAFLRATGWVEHDPEDIWRQRARDRARALWNRAGMPRTTWPASASPTSARPRVVWDRADRRADPHAIVWQDRRTAPTSATRLNAETCEALVTARTGLLLDPYFSATKIAWLLDTCGGRACAAEAGRARLRHRRQLPALAADRRRRARDRRHQRLAHAAVRHPSRRWDDGTAGAVSACRARCCPRSAIAPADFGVTAAALFGASIADPRHRRRPAGGADRPGLLRARHGQIDLRHRLLRPAQHRREGRRSVHIGC